MNTRVMKPLVLLLSLISFGALADTPVINDINLLANPSELAAAMKQPDWNTRAATIGQETGLGPNLNWQVTQPWFKNKIDWMREMANNDLSLLSNPIQLSAAMKQPSWPARAAQIERETGLSSLNWQITQPWFKNKVGWDKTVLNIPAPAVVVTQPVKTAVSTAPAVVVTQPVKTAVSTVPAVVAAQPVKTAVLTVPAVVAAQPVKIAVSTAPAVVAAQPVKTAVLTAPSAIYLAQNAAVTQLVNWPARLLVIGKDTGQTNLALQMQQSTWPATLANLQAEAKKTNNTVAESDLLELAKWPANVAAMAVTLNAPALGWMMTQGWWPNQLVKFQMQVFNLAPMVFPHTTVLQAFAPTSFWYQPIPLNAPFNPNQAAYQANFTSQYNTWPMGVGVNVGGGASTVFTVPANQPTMKVTLKNCGSPTGYIDPTLQAQFAAGVPIPSYATGDQGSDHEMTIYQPSTNTMWEFWVAQKVNGAWSACWGGEIQNAKTSDGVFYGNYGATATSLPFLGGQVSAEELQNGVINHVIGLSLPYTAPWNIVSWPAHRSDGGSPGIIPEGTRFRIDPTINIDTLGLTYIGKIIAKAGQVYGFVVWDRTGGGGGLNIRFNDNLSYTAGGGVNPYPALFGPFPEYSVLGGIPFDKLQFLPLDYGKP